MGPGWARRITADDLTRAQSEHVELFPVTSHGPMMGMQNFCRQPRMGPAWSCGITADDLTWAQDGLAESLPMTSHGPMMGMQNHCR
jgi:hypothetical protein